MVFKAWFIDGIGIIGTIIIGIGLIGIGLSIIGLCIIIGIFIYTINHKIDERYKKCQFCAKTIKKEAIVCPYCNRDILKN